MAKKQTPEGKVLSEVIAELKSMGWLYFRMNSGVLKNPSGRPITFGVPGMADLLAFPRVEVGREGDDSIRVSHPLWIECKSQVGVQSPVQKEFENRVKEENHTYIVVRSVDDFRGWTKLVEALAR